MLLTHLDCNAFTAAHALVEEHTLQVVVDVESSKMQIPA